MRTIELPASMAHQPLLLYIERTKPSTLWIDGDSIGSLGHIYAPHIYQLPALNAGPHRIDIRIDNSETSVPKEIQGSHAWTDATQTNWNGILGDFYLEALPASYIDDLQVYPDVEKKTAEIMLKIHAERKANAKIRLKAQSFNTDRHYEIEPQSPIDVRLEAGENHVRVTLPMGSHPLLWSEFHPNLYRLTAQLTGRGFEDSREVQFGMRDFHTEGNRFVVNGKYTFLRGKHDGCVFPLTGYAPTDVKEWRRYFQIAKQYGINHVRFHSWAPTRAAFEAADLEGVYLAPELPLWGTIDTANVTLNNFLRNEGRMLLDFVGNSPSFCMMGLGNELWGSVDEMNRWINDFRQQDPRHLYNHGSNDFLGWTGAQEGEDYFTTCRVGNAIDQSDLPENERIPEPYSSHVRSSFSFADADEGGILNVLRPNTRRHYGIAIDDTPRPIISHETCQFQIYPDFDEIQKYTGVLYPYNYEVFRKRLTDAGMLAEARTFHDVTGRWSMACYKADIEYVLRTPHMGGYQLLDLQDYPGQGSALCAPLDAFMETKGLITPEDFRKFCSPVVPLAYMDSLCFSTRDSLRFDLALFNYSEGDWTEPLYWSVLNAEGTFAADGKADKWVAQGEVSKVGHVSLPLSDVTAATKLVLLLESGQYHNAYSLWVYPEVNDGKSVKVFTSLDSQAENILSQGGTVLLCPDHAQVEQQTVGSLFTPDYWNYAMFKTISENNQRPVSPGTLGFLVNGQDPSNGNPQAKLFAQHLSQYFPNDGRSDWQWWSIAHHTRPLILDGEAYDQVNLLQVVDNVNRSHQLGALMEYRVGKGRLIICMTDLDAISQYPEGRAYAAAIRTYAAQGKSSSTQLPSTSIAHIRHLLSRLPNEKDIQGVENISDYAQPK